MKPGRRPDLPPAPENLTWFDRARLLADRAAAIKVLERHSFALRDLLWTGLATAGIAGGWLMALAVIGWYLSLNEPEGMELGVAVALMVALLLAEAAAVLVFVRVTRRGRVAQRLLEEWTALDRQPTARSLPSQILPGPPAASTWDLMRAGQPWQETVPVNGRRYLVFMSAGAMTWMLASIAPLMFGTVMMLATFTGDVSTTARVGAVGGGAVLATVGLWVMGKGWRHYAWALKEARIRVLEEKTWPVASARR
ncbi:hypothetical protein [Streptomyces sp. TRM68416]|uniref:hypothetical protein n=1 Tax=Streptomyces sp. TRM68416 TaxID=2758412 RepID=UPI001661E3C0|nr:hypothetical protein [Streptomyces sp. TRM68416]MBD0842752.1 hypothetical protein [Streptomyces sp. TRM68416]